MSQSKYIYSNIQIILNQSAKLLYQRTKNVAILFLTSLICRETTGNG